MIHSTATDKIYVGLSKNLKARKSQHLGNSRGARYHNSNANLQHAIEKYGKDTFSFMVVYECPEEQLVAAEIAYAAYYKASGYELFNIAECGSALTTMSAEARAKIGRANSGTKRTAEQKAAMSLARTGRKQSPEHIEASAKARRGLKRTDEQKAYMRKQMLEKRDTPEYRQKLKDGIALRDAKRRASKVAV